MDFLEAVKALSEGRCEEITRPGWIEGLSIEIGRSGHPRFVGLDDPSYSYDCNDFLATDWELVNEKPLTEEVEWTAWKCMKCTKLWDTPEECACLDKYTVKLTGTYTREVKRKVKRREEMFTAVSNDNFYYHGISNERVMIPKRAKLIAEWEEEE